MFTCLFRGMSTMAVQAMRMVNPNEIEVLSDEIFRFGNNNGSGFVLWPTFWEWAQTKIKAPIFKQYQKKCSMKICCSRAIKSADMFQRPKTSRGYQSPTEDETGEYERDQDVEPDISYNLDNIPMVEHLDEPSNQNYDTSCHPEIDEMENPTYHDTNSLEASSEEKIENDDTANNSGFLDPEVAIEQVIACLPEIDNGDLSSLPWMLEALKQLSSYKDCSILAPYVPNLLPLICNVAACEDNDLSREALQILAYIIDGAPSQLAISSETVNEQALMEMCLVRAVDSDPGISAGAEQCLARIAERHPYGFGRTLAALLEAGTLHDDPEVVKSCASTVEKAVEHLPSGEEETEAPTTIGPDLEGRASLLLSALSLWAHGENIDCRQSAKLIILKLSLRFNGVSEWDESVKATESPLLIAWNDGQNLTFEEEENLSNQARNRGFEEKFGQEGDDSFAKRGWMVPAGEKAFRCPENACMYPQVFAILGFKGKGGAAVGISENCEFDVAGSFRKREIIQEKRITEFTKVMWNGSIKVWSEEEETVKETTHLESAHGEFAHREFVKLLQKETMDGEVLVSDETTKDFVHFKNETGEFASYVDQNPQSPQLSGEQPLYQYWPAPNETPSGESVIVEEPDSP